MGRGKHMPQEAPEGSEQEALRYASAYHAPVLCKVVVQTLVTDPRGVYADGTLGGGGHTAALLAALHPEGRVIGIDQDADAHRAVQQRLAPEIEKGRLRLVRANFAELGRLLPELGVGRLDGLLLDLGVSSHQLDEASRGFSYAAEGALDMRMDDRLSLSAAELLNEWSEAELRRLFFRWGEEPRAAAVARALAAARPLATTHDVARVLRRIVAGPGAVKTLARVFQAVRIAVNGELEALERTLGAAPEWVRPGGRLVVISYHSLEDRPVKHYLRFGNAEGRAVKDLYGNVLSPWQPLTRKPVTPEPDELLHNPRSRSARLRAAERTTYPAPPG